MPNTPKAFDIFRASLCDENHYIPCFYTKEWSDQSGKIAMYSCPHSLCVDRVKFPTQVGYQTDLYTLPGISDNTRYDLETKFFRELDQRAAHALAKIKRGSALTIEERTAWATFIISLSQRNPQKMAEIASRANDMFERDIDQYRIEFEQRRQAGETGSFEDFLASLRESQWFERQNKLLVQSAILLRQSTEALVSFEWSLLKLNPEKNHDLLTSDRPVIMTNGIAHAEGHVALPVGPKALFVAARSKNTIRAIERTHDLGRSVNDKIVRQAHEQVYGTTRLQLPFIRKRLRKPQDASPRGV